MSITLNTTMSSIMTNKRRVGALKSLGVVTVGDALTYYPFRVADPVPLRALREARIGERMAFSASVRGMRVVPMNVRRGYRLEAVVDDGDFAVSRHIAGAAARLVFFSYKKQYVDWLSMRLRSGAIVVIAGEPSEFNGQLQFTHPEIMTVAPGSGPADGEYSGVVQMSALKYDADTVEAGLRRISRPRPVYHASSRISSEHIHESIVQCIELLAGTGQDLPGDAATEAPQTMKPMEDGGISGNIPNWAPVAGGTVNLLNYPQMGAGEQRIRVTFNGDEAYRSSTPIEGNLTVNKAKVSVKVHSTSIYADEAKDKLGEGFVTTDPADKFDIYTIYGGMTSDVTTSVFVQLPERYTNTALIKAIDWALEQAGQPTLTEMMNNGTTVGQLRKILSDVISRGADLPQFIKDALKKANIDIDTLVKLNDALSKLPGLLDNVRVAIGTPNQAGLYVVTAGTNNKNISYCCF